MRVEGVGFGGLGFKLYEALPILFLYKLGSSTHVKVCNKPPGLLRQNENDNSKINIATSLGKKTLTQSYKPILTKS